MSAVVHPQPGETRPLEPVSGARGISKRSVTLAVILAQLVLWYLLLNGGSWVYDDNLALALAGRSGLTWSWLTSIFFQHWGIGYHFVYSAIHALMPVDYRWALVAMLAFLGGAMYLLQRIFSLLFGARWLAVAAAAYFGVSIFFVQNLQWLASGLQYLPGAFFDLLCLYGYVRFQIDRSARWAVVSAAGLAGGLLFFEKPAFMVLYLAMLRILFLCDDLHPRALLGVFWRERVMWAGLIVVAAAWAIGEQVSGGGTGLVTGTVTLSQYAQYFRILWVETLIPGLLGMTVPANGLDAAQIAFVVVLQLVVIGAVAVSVLRKPSAWRAWVFLAVAVIVSGILVARARIPVFGVGIAAGLRYLVDFSWLVPLAITFAFVRRRTLTPALDDPGEKLTLPFRLRPWVAVASVALVAYVVLSATTTAKLQRQWAGSAGRAWETKLQSTVGQLERGGTHLVIADGQTPFYIVAAAFAPYDQLSAIAPLYVPHAQVDGVLDGPLVTVDPTGVAHRAAIASRVGDGSMSRLVAAHQVAIRRAAKVVPQTSDTCVSAGAAFASVERTLSIPSGSAPGAYYLLISYAAQRPANLTVFVNLIHGPVGFLGNNLSLAGGSARNILYLGASAPRQVELEVNPGNTLCIKSMDVVTLRPVS